MLFDSSASLLVFCLGTLSIVEIFYYCVAVYFSLQFYQCLLHVQTIWLTMTQFVILYNVGTVIHISRNSNSIFDFWSFPRLVICSTTLSNRASHSSQSPVWSQGKQPIHLQTFYTHTTILLYTFITVANKSHEVFNTMIK